MYQHIHLCKVCITSVTWNNIVIISQPCLVFYILNSTKNKQNYLRSIISAQTMTMSTTGSGGTRTKLENALMKMSEAQSYWCWQWVGVGRVWFMNPTSKSAAIIMCADSPECCSAYVALHLMTYCFAIWLSSTHRPHAPSGKYVKPQELITVMVD